MRRAQWGSGDTGQLGHGKYETSSTPVRLDLSNLDNGRVTWTRVRTGEYHSGALTSNGKIYTWGQNTAGQLGLGHMERVKMPTLVKSLSAGKCLDVALGASFCVCAMDNSETLAWGQNSHGQLGVGDTESRSTPTVIVALRGVALAHISCGGRHVVSLDSQSRLWAWGDNAGGALCLGDGTMRTSPVMVQGSADLVLGHVACGYGHTLLLSVYEASEAQSRKFYSTGIVTMNDP